VGRRNVSVLKVVCYELSERRSVRNGKGATVDRRGHTTENVAVNGSWGTDVAVEPANHLEGEPIRVIIDNRVDYPAQVGDCGRVATGVFRVRRVVWRATGGSIDRCLEVIDDVANRVGNVGMVEEHFDSAHGWRWR